MKVTTPNGGVKDVRIEQVTADNYICPENEKHLYHVIVEVRKFNAETGERISKPRVQKFGKKAFESKVRKNLVKQGFTITMLHEAEALPEVKHVAPVTKTNVEDIVAAAVAKALSEQEEKHKADIEEAVANAVAAAKSKSGRKSNAEKAAEAAKPDAEPEAPANEPADGENDAEASQSTNEEF